MSLYGIYGGRKKQVWICPIYAEWKSMVDRCYSVKSHSGNPTYIGCTVDSGWHSFSSFREWMVAQPWRGNQIDKDILVQGNKVYGPDNCVFVSRNLNAFMNDRGAARGEWPIGVSWHKDSGKLASSCRNPFTRKGEYLGLFTCPDAAHEAWRSRKHQHACRYAEQQTDPRIAAALRTRYATPAGESK